MAEVSKKELRQRWVDFGASLGLEVTEAEARSMVRGQIFTGHDPNLNIARILAFRAGVAAAARMAKQNTWRLRKEFRGLNYRVRVSSEGDEAQVDGEWMPYIEFREQYMEPVLSTEDD